MRMRDWSSDGCSSDLTPFFIHARWARRRARSSATAKPPPRRRSASPAATTPKSWAMAEFAYLAIATSGKEQRGHIAAETIAAARAELDRRRLFVLLNESEKSRDAAPALFSLRRRYAGGRRGQARARTGVSRQYSGKDKTK